MKKVISFSLWGSEAKYNVGAVRNAQLALEIYPDWETWFYVGQSVPTETVVQLKRLGANIIEMGVPGDWTSMFWRFLPASDPTVDAMISRDSDSRLSVREKEAVREWLNSDRQFHIMRDHPSHSAVILGGMWGVKRGLLPKMVEQVANWAKEDRLKTDQDFLRQKIYPLVRNKSMVHDEFFEKRAFPVGRESGEFVGEPFDELDGCCLEGRALLKQQPIWEIQYTIANRWSVEYRSLAARLAYSCSKLFSL